MRAVPLAIGDISALKRERVLELRSRVLSLMRDMARAGFSPEPLDTDLRGKELDALLLEVQKSCAHLNSVWREQARMRVKPALEETVKRYFRRLAGSLRHVDQEIPLSGHRPDIHRRFFHIPESVQDAITEDEITGLKAIAETGGAVDAFRQWRSGNHSFTPAQAAVLADIHGRAQKRHAVPDFGLAEDFTLQLHLDARMLPQGQAFEALALREGASTLLADDGNALYYRFLDIAGVAPHENRIRLPLAMTRKIAQRLAGTDQQWAALILEISERAIGVRLVAGKPEAAMPAEVRAFVGRDFGYANTVSLSVASNSVPCDLDALRSSIKNLTDKDAVRAFLESRNLPEDARIVERVRFDGRAFLNRVSKLCERIDALKSRIDLEYNALHALRRELVAGLGLGPEERIAPERKRTHPAARAFFALLGRINDMKKTRRDLYRRIVAIKKAWFGFLSNIEIALARKHDAAIVREDLTVAAIGKDDLHYKGRTFNKMLNNGSKGQYQKRAADKMLWNGVPEIVVPSWYTSRACLAHSAIVEKQRRKGERIFLPCCNRHDHADEHAADTIACYPFLRPRLTRDVLAHPRFVTPASPSVGSPVI